MSDLTTVFENVDEVTNIWIIEGASAKEDDASGAVAKGVNRCRYWF